MAVEELSYGNAVDALLAAFPDFAGAGFDRDSPHDVFGSFAIHLRDQIRAGHGDALMGRALGFFNAMADSTDDEVLNLLEISVFEILADDEVCLPRIQPRLTSKARAHLDRVLRGGSA